MGIDMKKFHFYISRILSAFLIITFITPSIDVLASIAEQTETQCGYWNVEVSMKAKDARILSTFIPSKSGKDCQGTFSISNETDADLNSEGYTLELQTNTNNAIIEWIPSEDKSEEKFLLPPLISEITATPIDRTTEATVFIQGDMSLNSLKYDIGLLSFRAGLALIPEGTACLISEEQILFAVTRSYDSLNTVSDLAMKRDILGSRDELEHALPNFYIEASDYLDSVGRDCFLGVVEYLLKSDWGIINISYHYLAWIVVQITDYIKHGGGSADVLLVYTPPKSQTLSPEVEDYSKVYLGEHLIFDIALDAPGCFTVGGVMFSPTNEHFLIVPHCLEGDNLAFIFNKDGSGKREITGQWDYVNYGNIDWSPDGEWIIYHRINSFGAEVHPEELPEGLVLYNVSTGEKTLFYSISGPPTYGYPTSPAWSPDGRWIAFLYDRYNAPLTVYLLESNLSSQWKLDEFEYQDNYGTLEWEMNEDEQFMNLNYFEFDEEIPDRTYIVSTLPGATPPGTPVPLNDEADQKLYYVIDVQIGDVLNIRSQPGPEHPKVGEIPHDGRNVQIMGEGVMVGIRMWVPVNYGEMTGWVNSKFLKEQNTTDSGVETMLEQLALALNQGDIDQFEKLMFDSTIEYGSGLSGGRTPIPREEFLQMVAERIISSPLCEGYSGPDDHITVWTSGWEPDWENNRGEPSDVINFSFFDWGNGLSLGTAYFTPLPDILTLPTVDSKPCPQP